MFVFESRTRWVHYAWMPIRAVKIDHHYVLKVKQASKNSPQNRCLSWVTFFVFEVIILFNGDYSIVRWSQYLKDKRIRKNTSRIR